MNVVKIMNDKRYSESIRDICWLISVSRLPVRAVVSWSCYVKTTKCPMIYCDEKETQKHLLIDCYRAQQVWNILQSFGLSCDINYNSVMYGLITENIPLKHKELYQLVIIITTYKLWKTRCAMSIQQTVIDGDMVIKHILADLRKRRTLDKKTVSPMEHFALLKLMYYLAAYLHRCCYVNVFLYLIYCDMENLY